MKRLTGGIVLLAIGVVGVLVSGCVSDEAYQAVKNHSEQQAMLIAQYQEENRQLDLKVQSLQATLAERNRVLALMEEKEGLLKQRLEEVSVQTADLLEKLKGLEGIQGVSVEATAEGWVKVGVAAEVLFDSGKAVLKPKGQDALMQVAAVLKGSREFIRIDGHTDSDPIKYSAYKSNWELSGARAVTVLEQLVSQGVAPERLYFAGHGPYKPIAANATKEGKAKNRRVELLVMPGTAAPKTDIPREAGAVMRVAPTVEVGPPAAEMAEPPSEEPAAVIEVPSTE